LPFGDEKRPAVSADDFDLMFAEKPANAPLAIASLVSEAIRYFRESEELG